MLTHLCFFCWILVAVSRRSPCNKLCHWKSSLRNVETKPIFIMCATVTCHFCKIINTHPKKRFFSFSGWRFSDPTAPSFSSSWSSSFSCLSSFFSLWPTVGCTCGHCPGPVHLVLWNRSFYARECAFFSSSLPLRTRASVGLWFARHGPEAYMARQFALSSSSVAPISLLTLRVYTKSGQSTKTFFTNPLYKIRTNAWRRSPCSPCPGQCRRVLPCPSWPKWTRTCFYTRTISCDSSITCRRPISFSVRWTFVPAQSGTRIPSGLLQGACIRPPHSQIMCSAPFTWCLPPLPDVCWTR